ncbi:putative FBD-associated F-box protein At3g50710 [Aegilops tauschii subsp. strangulata]|uniref:FBD domain-containing protein n=1 Tax=Aegilops tauschii subsp. strangulata TaxID=200361 RepID=A0A453SER9_AEGTS|nr:putative FBD-associated F-box protein At3g50710 [Aegilops tauschii subsp. strangulata]
MGDGAASHPAPRYNGEDRISALPNDLLGDIITRLPFMDAARTAAFASHWRQIWRSTPLVLRDADAHLSEATHVATVARALADHPGPFHTVSLFGCRAASLDLELPEWPRLLTTKRIENLCFHNKQTQLQTTLSPLPADILCCGSLQSLSLAFWKIPDDLLLAANAFPNLRKLGLVRNDMSDQYIHRLLVSSPILEYLGLVLNGKPERVHVCSQSLRCLFLGLSKVEEFTVVDTPLLERIMFFKPPYGGTDCVRFRIASAPKLRVIGYLEPRIHKLQIGGSIIKPDTMASPGTVVPGVEVLALKVNFGVFWEVKMLASFLRCFPNVGTLHIESVQPDPSVAAHEPTGEHHARFWKEASPVESLRLHIRSLFIHKFQGDQNEFEFLKYVALNARELRALLVVSPDKKIALALADEVNEMANKLDRPLFQPWTARGLLESPRVRNVLISAKVPFLGVRDPFRW